MPYTPLSNEEFRAMGELAKARRQLLVNMFQGTQLKFGTASMLGSGKKLLAAGKKLKSKGGVLASGAGGVKKAASVPGIQEAFKDFMVECADVDGIEDVIAAIGSEALSELVGEVTPFLGVAVSAVKLGKAAKAVATDGRNLYKSGDYKQGFRMGDPYAAAEAIQAIIKRDLAQHSVKLAKQTAATGAKVAGLFADMGTATTAAIGVANTLASIGLQLASLGLDIKDMRAGNKRLATPNTLDLTVFNDSPILGCYLLTCADTSAVANMFIADIGLPGWMSRLEAMKKKQMDPMLKIATKAITGSRLQLEGLSSNKGTHTKKNFFAKSKSKIVKQLGLS